jgi:hypothetical protein
MRRIVLEVGAMVVFVGALIGLYSGPTDGQTPLPRGCGAGGSDATSSSGDAPGAAEDRA